jgi:rhamnose transport system ATP-binding protein
MIATVDVDGISKRFGATQALDGVSLQLLPAEVHGLVGENGAGKSTLVKILAGVHQLDAGQIRIDGAPVRIHGPAHARALGVAVIHQEPRLFPDLSVAENVFLGHQPKTAVGTIDWSTMRRDAARLFENLAVSISAESPVRGLSMADQQLVEIAKALSVDARI